MNPADVNYAKAISLFNQNLFEEAAAFARECLDATPDDGRLWRVRGLACWAIHDHEAAREALEQATVLIPLNPLARVALAECYARNGDKELALTLYEHLLEGDHCTDRLLPRVAVGLNTLGEFKLALRACRLLTERNPAHHQAHFGVAFYLGRLGASPAELLPHLAMAVDLAPGVGQYRLNLACVLADLGRDDEARELLRGVSFTDIPCPCMQKRLGRIFRRDEGA